MIPSAPPLLIPDPPPPVHRHHSLSAPHTAPHWPTTWSRGKKWQPEEEGGAQRLWLFRRSSSWARAREPQLNPSQATYRHPRVKIYSDFRKRTVPHTDRDMENVPIVLAYLIWEKNSFMTQNMMISLTLNVWGRPMSQAPERFHWSLIESEHHSQKFTTLAGTNVPCFRGRWKKIIQIMILWWKKIFLGTFIRAPNCTIVTMQSFSTYRFHRH